MNHKNSKVRENLSGTNVAKWAKENTLRGGWRNVSQLTQKLNLKVHLILTSSGEYFRKAVYDIIQRNFPYQKCNPNISGSFEISPVESSQKYISE